MKITENLKSREPKILQVVSVHNDNGPFHQIVGKLESRKGAVSIYPAGSGEILLFWGLVTKFVNYKRCSTESYGEGTGEWERVRITNPSTSFAKSIFL